MLTCSLYSIDSPSANTATMVINSPISIASTTTNVGTAAFGPALPTTPITSDVVYVDDGSTAVVSDPTTASIYDGCQLPLQDLTGKIALIQRGNCTFATKVENAQAKGAVAVMIANYDDGPVTMGGASTIVTIPAISISSSKANTIINTLTTQAVNVSMYAVPPSPAVYSDNSIRWLEGEQDGLGGAIRDLWNPSCYHHPGKVSDDSYYCGVGDSGGAHTNMDVVTHAFALLVDGGNYNNFTIPAIGMTKAVHIYHRAQAAYQTQTMNFTDHAAALRQACGDLLGSPLASLGTNIDSGQRITTADCDSVNNAIAAVELEATPNCQVKVGVGVTVGNTSVVEGNSGFTPMVFTVRLSAISTVPVTMDYQAIGITAQQGKDFNPTKGKLTIQPCQQEAQVIVPIKGDVCKEPNETLLFQITNVVGASDGLISNQAIGTIINDDNQLCY